MDKKFLLICILFLSIYVSAEDQLKPVLDEISDSINIIFSDLFGNIKLVVDKIGEIFFGIFPGLDESLENLFFWDPEEDYLAWVVPLRGLFWMIYIAAFIVIAAIMVQLWQMSKRLAYNTVSGMALILLLIHVLGVEIKFTVFNVLLVVLLGVPGTLLILLFHYL